MKLRLLVCTLFLTGFVLPVGVQAQDDRGGMVSSAELSTIKNPLNHPPFQQFAARPSGPIDFLLTEQGKKMVRMSSHPNLRGLLSKWGIDVGSAPTALSPVAAPAASIAASTSPCDTKTGTKFNLEPTGGMAEIGFPVPQNEESVDFIPGGGTGGADLVVGGANDYRGIGDSYAGGFSTTPAPNAWGLSLTGYYVHSAGNGCSATFEGGLPHIVASTGETLFGGGDPVDTVDSVRGNIYATDLRFGFTTSGVGFFNTTAANIRNSAVCPPGTHLTDSSGNDTTASACWPRNFLFNSVDPSVGFSDKPHTRTDERASGVGAGDVYVSWTFFNFVTFTTSIQLAVCNPRTTCSKPITISGSDPNVQFSHIAVRADGVLTITYANQITIFNPNAIPFFVIQQDIKYVSCTPNGAPNAPTCSAPSEVFLETQPVVGFLAENDFRVFTYPTHDQRLNGGAFEEFIAWSRCKVPPFIPFGTGQFVEDLRCPDADVVITSSLTDASGNPLGWSAVQPVNANLGDQFFPWVKVNHDTNSVNIVYYSSENDFFHHRLQVLRSRIDSGTETVNSPTVLTSTLNEPASDIFLGAFFFGDYIGVASKGSSNYANFTSNALGLFGGSLVPGQNNNLTLDHASN